MDDSAQQRIEAKREEVSQGHMAWPWHENENDATHMGKGRARIGW